MPEETTPGRATEYLANERTFLAWLRTCIALMGLGFVVSRFSLFLREFSIITKVQQQPGESPAHSLSTLLGMAMIVLGVVLLVYSLSNYVKAQRAIAAGQYAPKNNIMYVATAGLAVFGAIVIFYLLLVSA